MAKLSSPIDPLRAEVLELCEKLHEHTITLRDYATTPDNAWLAAGELQAMTVVMSDIEELIEKIRRFDAGED